MKLTGKIGWPVAGLLLIAQASFSAESDIKVGMRDEEIPEVGVVSYSVFTTPLNEFVFLPPPRWKRDIDAKAGVVVLTSPDFLSTIRIQIPEQKSEETPVLKSDSLKQSLLQEMADARITEESPSYTAGLAGFAFDAERVVENKIKVRTRDTYFAVAGGAVRISLAAPADQFVARQLDLNRFLNSFRTTRRKS